MVKKLLAFFEPEIPLCCSHQTATEPCAEVHEYRPRPILISILITAVIPDYISQVGSFLQIFPLKVGEYNLRSLCNYGILKIPYVDTLRVKTCGMEDYF